MSWIGHSMRIGVLGGTFDPIHNGHLEIARQAIREVALDFVLFIPTGRPWMKAGLNITASKHRLAMVRLAIQRKPKFRESTIEVDRNGLTYTIDTLISLKEQYGEQSSLFFILGMDSLETFPRWKQPDEILNLCTLVAALRPDQESLERARIVEIGVNAREKIITLNNKKVKVSGENIREMLLRGKSIKGMVPSEVEEYIEENHIYGEAHLGYRKE
jgi:nicotinate-nucleotide adenylyltransferase